ncbi:MAG: M28 family peptidase [Bacteroidales bacterium]
MKNVLFIVISILCFSLFAQNNKDVEKLKKIIYTFADDSMQGRAAGSDGEQKAKNYLVSYFKTIGLQPINDSFIQEFTFSKDTANIDTAYNIIGYIDYKADSTIIIGAHYDHIGLGGPKSRSLTDKKIHPGADDNASGVAALLLISDYLKTKASGNSNYCIVFFSAHEEGLFGSNDFVNKKYIDLLNIKLVINLDMVGRLDTSAKNLVIRGEETNLVFDSIFKTLPHPQFHVIRRALSQGDHTPFVNQGIPCLSFTTGVHDDYHKPSDTPDKINYTGLSAIVQFVEQMIVLYTEKNNTD